MIEHKKVVKLDMMKYYIMSQDISHDEATCTGGELLNIVMKTNKPAKIPMASASTSFETAPVQPAPSPSKGDNLKFSVSPSTEFNVRTVDLNESSGDFLLRKLSQQKDDPFFYGHALGPRSCGRSEFTRNALYLFAEPSRDLSFNSVTLEKDVKYMMVQLEEESRPCVYRHYDATIFTDTSARNSEVQLPVRTRLGAFIRMIKSKIRDS